ncbi:MAG: NADH:flavin oxidoreductase/NADH oxidase family protein [Pseudomonadales bacterium]|jgi:2,4-dienoyl-CoA reductase-like NADH-dependent reductase (Old Yellow Enzyme family)|nr:NADH:flavin oxidoreductase/NADH oxidase family protein [Pseudomonadales bacterium]
MASIEDPFPLPCGVVLPNRLAKAAMTEGLADAWNRPTAAHARLYRRWAEGGCGLLLTGNVQVDRRHLERPGNVVLDGEPDAEARAGFEAWSAAAHAGGARIVMQLSHAGRQTPDSVNARPSAPSAVALGLPTGFGAPRAMTADEIEQVRDGFLRAARIARETGFDGVQVHAAHGYLLSQFLNPRVNQRVDEWGGSLENRARLLLDIVRAIRAEQGDGFALSVKLNSSDFQQGAFSHEDSLTVARWLGEAGIDLLELSGGNYEQPRMMGAEGMEPVFEEAVRESTRRREAYFFAYALDLREVTRVPLMVTGGFRTRAGMDEALAEDACDLIGLGRPLCFAPEAPRQLLEGTRVELPRLEDRLRLGPGPLGPHSRFDVLKAANAWGAQGSFCLQILRMGAGRDPDRHASAWKGLFGYQRTEAEAARRWRAANPEPIDR